MKMQPPPIISVIIPTYNREKYVVEAVQSVLVQSQKNIEIVVVDDGSTDNTGKIFADNNYESIVRYYYKPNAGAAAARNFGIKQARGEFIAFLDSDDLLINESLTLQLNRLQSNPRIGLVHGNFSKISDTHQNLGVRETSYFKGEIYPDMLSHWSGGIATPTVMVPARVLQETGGFDEELGLGEDIDMWRRIARKYEFDHIPQVLATVRSHSGNISGDRFGGAEALHKVLEKAFEDDPHLPMAVRKRAMGQMHAFAGFNLLADHDAAGMTEARKWFCKAISFTPGNITAYLGWCATFIPINVRKLLGKIWRRVRYPSDPK